MHDLGVGATHAGKPVTILITVTEATVIHNGTGEVLASNTTASLHDHSPSR